MSINVWTTGSQPWEDPRGFLDILYDFKQYITICLLSNLCSLLDAFPQVTDMLFKPLNPIFFLSAVVVNNINAAPAAGEYTTNAESAFNTLQKWYNSNNGQYNTTGWWNSANCLTTIGDLAAIDPNVKAEVITVLANSYIAAPASNLQTTKIILPDFMIQSFHDSSVPDGIVAKEAANPKGFLNDYYDDEGWWALAWIQAYDITLNTEYLKTAEDIFEDMKNGSTSPCGGIWWSKDKTYVNAIANELYLSVASHLATRADNKQYYLDIAKAQFDWFQSSGMINSNNLINDGLDSSCQNNGGTVWSYNQGVILGAAVELNNASPNATYLTLAKNVATATIESLGASGILHDPCEPSCGADGATFKGVFMRNLHLLQQAAPDATYLNFIAANAKSIWANDRNSTTTELGINWGGPFISPADAGTQNSALDALVAAAAFEANGIDS
jgi:predicted alpha-1,6-mannanase (GH76 family)